MTDSNPMQQAAAWLLTRDEILQSPSRADGIAFETELVMRHSMVTQLMQIGQKKDIKKQVIATACVLFHRFFSRRSFKRFDRLEVALVCLVLAGKTVDFVQPVLFKAIIPERLQRQGHKAPVPEDSDLWKATKEQLVLVERHVLSALEFDSAVELPFPLVEELCVKVGLAPPDHPLRELAIKMLNDLLKTTLVLHYSPHVLAQAGLLFAKGHLEKLNSMGKGPAVVLPPTWDVHVTLSPEVAQNVMAQFNEFNAIARREIEKQAQAMQAGAGARQLQPQATGQS